MIGCAGKEQFHGEDVRPLAPGYSVHACRLPACWEAHYLSRSHARGHLILFTNIFI